MEMNEKIHNNDSIRVKSDLKAKKEIRLYSSVIPIDNNALEAIFSPSYWREQSGIKAVTKSFKEAKFNLRDKLICFATFSLFALATYLIFIFQPDFVDLRLSRMNSVSGIVLLTFTALLLLVKVSFLIYIFTLFFKYKAVKSVSDEELPTVTVIVPAYNEGKLVYSTLISLIESDYPAEKLQLISIDDGSVDDTWDWMQKAKVVLGDRLSIYQQPHNQGKRHALYRGFHLATGDIFVTVDSDSIVKKDTLRNLVSPFVVNEKCGAVAGNVRVLNNQKAIIPRMLNVSFTFSFEFIRSAQSAIGSVLCTPGALSAYRKEAAMNCLPEWIEQKFMGKVSKIGEDRAMTNMILKQGYHVQFQKNAYVLTNIPENYKGLYKMFTRWERSNVRENLMMAKFAFTNFRTESKLGTRILLANQLLKMTLAIPVFFLMCFFFVSHPVMFLSSTLVSIMVFATIPTIFYAKKYNFRESLWAYTYGIFFAFGLFWITPYALATAGRGGWLTRDLPTQ